MPRAWDSPDAFQGALQRFDIVPLSTGSAYSSHGCNSWWFNQFVLQVPVVISNINVYKSMDYVVPGAATQASSGSEAYSYKHGVTIFKRQDYQSNSSNLSFVTSASFGLSLTLGYSSATQTAGMSWVTDSTGGISSISTSTAAGSGYSSYFTGPKKIQIPLVAVLTAGEYWIAHNHSSTTKTSNSNVTILSFSNLHVVPQVQTWGLLGATKTVSGVMDAGLASAVTINAAMPISVITQSAPNLWVQGLINV